MQVLCIIVLNFFFGVHPLHVSVTEIEMDKKDKALEITMRVFADDLEIAFRKNFLQPSLDIFNLKNSATLDQRMMQYQKDRFRIFLDGKAQSIKYLGHEIEDDAIIFYSEVTSVKKWQTITLYNDMITEIFEDQSNLVHVTVGEEVKSLRLMRNTPQDKLTFSSK